MQTLIMAGAVYGGMAWVSWQYNWNIPFEDFRDVSGKVIYVVHMVLTVPSFIPMFSMMIRRTRDAGLPPWLAVFSLIPLYGYVWMLILYFLPSKYPLPPVKIKIPPVKI